MKIYNVFQVSGMGYYMYMATCKTREAANKYIANLCKKRPDVYKKSYLKIRIGKILEQAMCKYCEQLDGLGCGEDFTDDDSWTDRFHLRRDSDGTYRIECYVDQSSPINFCPKCGRPLCVQK